MIYTVCELESFGSGKDEWWALVNVVMILQMSYKALKLIG